jgi:hypothetical protein
MKEAEAKNRLISNNNVIVLTLNAKTDPKFLKGSHMAKILQRSCRVAVTTAVAEAWKNVVVTKACAAEVAVTSRCEDVDAQTTIFLSAEELIAAVAMENSGAASVEATTRTTILNAITKTRPDNRNTTERCSSLLKIMDEAFKKNKDVGLVRAL